MADWQVEFYMVPRRALAIAGGATARGLTDADWWAKHALPSDYQRRLAALAPAASPSSADVETWGPEDGNRVEVRSNAGRVLTVTVRVDVRRLDSRFGAALLHFVRSADAVLVRSDGRIVEPVIGAYVAALRTAKAWQFASDPTSFLAGYAESDDE